MMVVWDVETNESSNSKGSKFGSIKIWIVLWIQLHSVIPPLYFKWEDQDN